MERIRSSLRLAVPAPFEFPLVVKGHGWFDLAPHRWDDREERLDTALFFEGQAIDCRIRTATAGLRVEVESRSRLDRAALERLRRVLRRMLRLDEDLTGFWRLCRRFPGTRWAARRGGGRLLRSATLFEDLMKLLFTTNCSWSLTRALTANLVAACGPRTPGGARAFPTPEILGDRDERFWRDEVRAGYRAASAVELVARFLDGRLDPVRLESIRDADLLRSELLALRGFGPYAAGQAARLLGLYQDLAIDSWCRARIMELEGMTKVPTDRSIARRYAAFGDHAGLGLWMDLTRDWHD